MKNKYLIGLFAFALLLFAYFSRIVIFHDTYEYITIAKNMAGINNINVYLTHSIFYPFITSLFLRIWPSFTMIKILNVFWVFLIALTILIWLKNKKAFFIFAFSPIVWYTGIQTTPILPASFFFLLAYIFIKKDYKFYSGLALGLSFAFYTPMILFGAIFTLIYLWNKKLSDLTIYLIAFCIGASPIFILNFYYFGNPFYSMIRYFGGNFVLLLGLKPNSTTINVTSSLMRPLILVAISPFLFLLVKLRDKKEIILLVSISILIFIQAPNIKYFFLIAPIVIIILSNILSDRNVKTHILISVVLIVFLTSGFFSITHIQNDLNEIQKDFSPDYIIGDVGRANKLAMFLWEDSPKVIWFEEYEKNKSMKSYSIKLNKNNNINTREELILSIDFQSPYDIYYENYIFVSEDAELVDESLKLIKCYEVLCVYEEGKHLNTYDNK